MSNDDRFPPPHQLHHEVSCVSPGSRPRFDKDLQLMRENVITQNASATFELAYPSSSLPLLIFLGFKNQLLIWNMFTFLKNNIEKRFY